LKLNTNNSHFLLILLVFGASWVHSLSFYGNQSHIDWKSTHTENFSVHFAQQNQPFVEEVLPFAEQVYDTIVGRYRIHPAGKINLIIRRALYSNGLTMPASNLIDVLDTDWGFKVRSTHHWMADVITHEFAHLVSIRNASKLHPMVHGLFFSFSDFYNEDTRTDFTAAYPLTVHPIWFAEGTAQYESYRLGFDAWDTHRDMILRINTLEDKLFSLSQMESFTSDDPFDGEKGGYLQGFSMVLFIAEEFGDEAIIKLWSELSRIHTVSFDGACRRVLGMGDKELYHRWKARITQRYQTFQDSLGQATQGTKLSNIGYYHDNLRASNGTLFGISNFGAPGFEGSLFAIPVLQDSLEHSDSTGIVQLSAYADSVPFTVMQKEYLMNGYDIRQSANGSQIVYVSYHNRDKNGRPYFDLLVQDTSTHGLLHKKAVTYPLTYRQDAIHPAFSPKGNEVVFVRREQHSARFRLSKVQVSLDSLPSLGSKVPNMDPATVPAIVDLVIPQKEQRILNIFYPRYSPDGSKVVFSYYNGQERSIGLVGADGSGFAVLVADSADNRDPVFTPDGQNILYASDRNGVFNLWQYNLQSKQSKQLTNVQGGAFTPEIIPLDSGFKVAYTQYDADGFSLYLISDSVYQYQIQQPALKSSTPNTVIKKTRMEWPEPVAFAAKPYRPIPNVVNFAPILLIQESAGKARRVDQGEASVMGGAVVGVTDPIGKNSLNMTLLLELGKGADYITTAGVNPNKKHEFFIGWQGRNFPITTQLGYSKRGVTSVDTVKYEDTRSQESSFGFNEYAMHMQALQGGLGYSVFKKRDSILADVSYSWSDFDLYQDNFRWTYHKQKKAALAMAWGLGQAQHPGSNGLSLQYGYSDNDLYRPGSFFESFKVVNGKVVPIYRNFAVHELSAVLWGGLSNPLHSGAKFLGSVMYSGLPYWQANAASEDTLDHFFHRPLLMAGYPVLADAETILLSAQNTAMVQVHYLFPIIQNLNARFWIFRPLALYGNVFAQGGVLWDTGNPLENIKINPVSGFYRSLGLEFRMHNHVFHMQKLDGYVRFSRGLDTVYKNGQQAIAPRGLQFPVLPTEISPTKVEIGIGFALSNPALSHQKVRQK
jgi:hypothetical protein